MQLATEKKDFYKLEVRVETPNVIIKNLTFEFEHLILNSEYEEEEIIIKDRRVIFEPEKTLDGFRVKVFILNEGENFKERIDYLIDEDYAIDDLSIKIINNNGQVYKYSVNEDVGEQVEGKEVEIELQPEMKNALNFITSHIEDGTKDVGNLCYQYLNEDAEAVSIVNSIAEISII